jgi:DNA-binding CsgD family transcriptional regulator
MYVSASESRGLARIFGLLSEDLGERDVREAVGHHLLELLEADHYASFVWQDATGRFENAVFLNMDPNNIAAYDRYYQDRDPITSKLQARGEATLVTQVMPQRDLMRTEFFNDFLARDGLHWGINAYSFVGGRNIGDVRIWRGRRRENFDDHTLELLRLIEPAFTGALARARGNDKGDCTVPEPRGGASILRLSVREFEIARMISDDLCDKEIAWRLGVEVSTVRTYLNRIFAKLGVRRRSGVAALFARHR